MKTIFTRIGVEIIPYSYIGPRIIVSKPHCTRRIMNMRNETTFEMVKIKEINNARRKF